MTKQPLRVPGELPPRPRGVFPALAAGRPDHAFQIGVGKDPDQRYAEFCDGIRRMAVCNQGAVNIRERAGPVLKHNPLWHAGVDLG